MIRVTKSNHCPICDKDSWCCLSDDMSLVVCMRVPSSLPAKSGGGHIHILKDRPKDRPPLPPPPTRLKKFDAEKYHAKIRAEWNHVLADGTALSLGVTVEALDRLKPGADDFNHAVGYPMRDADSKVVGIRLRNFMAKKFAVSGSSDGLFYDPALELGPERELVICEGPTDTAAAYTIGLQAVGRSSCGTGADLLKALCKRLGARLVTIVSDNDGYREVGGQLKRPGLDGAISLGRQLGRFYRVVTPPDPYKDLRAWVASGLTKDKFLRFADVATKKMG